MSTRRALRAATFVITGSLAAVTTARAQQQLVPGVTWSIGTLGGGWYFSDPIPQAAGRVGAVAQVAIPMQLRTTIGGWSVDVSGAAALGGVAFLAPEDSDAKGRLVQLSGLTDVRLRATGPLFSDALRLTVGVTVPTGTTGLNGEQTSALQVLAAPSLGLPVAAFGTGAGATIGVLRAFSAESWAFAVGASVEKRNAYSPVALALANSTFSSSVTPGTAVHVTAGLDRLVGAARWSTLVIADVYGQDVVSTNDNGVITPQVAYTLGPQITASTQFDFANAGWRERSLSASARRRSVFADSSGTGVAGSDGTYLDGAFNVVRGGPLGAGLMLGLDARWQSGLSFTDVMVGAAVSAVGATIGVEHAGMGTRTRGFLRAQYGSFDTGSFKTTGLGVTLGFTVGARTVLP